MSKRQKIALGLLVGLVGLSVAEQTTGWNFNFSHTLSGTHTYAARKPAPAGEIISLTRVDRPVTRWLPFIKFGETVHTHTAWERTPSTGETLERGDITRTSVLVIGFCSTAKYDELANQPFERWRKSR